MVFIAGNSILLLLEVISPCKYKIDSIILVFGYWHGVSLSITLFFSFMGSFMLNSYSTKMVQDIYLLPDGRSIEVNYFNAFWVIFWNHIDQLILDPEVGIVANIESRLSVS